MTELRPTGRLGVYVHVPFCRRHCPYCDFAVVVTSRVPAREYLEAVLAELDERAVEYDGRALATVYFGGGTPSLWGYQPIAEALSAIVTRLGGAPSEVTVEVNPEDVTAELLLGLRAAGVTRLSFGVQSFDDATLRLLGRHHTGAGARAGVLAAHETGFDRVSVDLVYAVPGEPAERLAHDLATIGALGGSVDHVSAYELTFEPRTAFSARVARGAMPPPDADAGWAAGRTVVAGLAARGFGRYEVSNFARPGGAAVHNAAYWSGDEYLGLGVGAHSLRVVGTGVERRANVRGLRAYLAGQARPTVERLGVRTHIAELAMVGVRTRRGVDLADLEARAGRATVAPWRRLAQDWERRRFGTISGGVFVPHASTLDIADILGAESVALADGSGV